jgi:hypothetical protein
MCSEPSGMRHTSQNTRNPPPDHTQVMIVMLTGSSLRWANKDYHAMQTNKLPRIRTVSLQLTSTPPSNHLLTSAPLPDLAALNRQLCTSAGSSVSLRNNTPACLTVPQDPAATLFPTITATARNVCSPGKHSTCSQLIVSLCQTRRTAAPASSQVCGHGTLSLQEEERAGYGDVLGGCLEHT